MNYEGLMPRARRGIRAASVVAVLDWEWPDPTAGLDAGADLGNEVRLEGIPDWLRDPRVIAHLSLHDRDMLGRMARWALVVDPERVAEVDRELTQPPEDRVRRANLALWLARPSGAGFELLVRGEQDLGGGWFVPRYERAPPLRAHQNDWEVELSADDLGRARILNEAVSRLSLESAPWAAARATWRALTEPWWEERYLLFWIAIEALFGPDDARGEITHRLCQRVAFFLESDRRAALALFRSAKDGYGSRSKIAHGLRSQRLGAERSLALMADVEMITRKALVAILESPQHSAVFGSRQQRESFLDGLAFTAPTP